MPDLPMPFRAALGLVATAVDEARRLPDRAIELPMLAVGTAMQLSLRAQQRYAELAARGEELMNRHEVTDEPPSWATFDEPVQTAPEPPDPEAPAHPIHAEHRHTRDLDTGADEAAETGGHGATKSVRSPRHTEPSRFDVVDDE